MITNKGLLGYYFEDDCFSNLIIMTPSSEEELSINKKNFNDIFLNKEIQSIRWSGYFTPKETGSFAMYTDSSNCIIECNNIIVYISASESNNVNLIKGNKYQIRIEKLFDKKVKLKDLLGVKLFYRNNNGIEQIVSIDELLQPNYSDTSEKNNFIPSENLFLKNSKTRSTVIIDSDNDNIPDEWEINGYTFMNNSIVKWEDSFAEEGYTKYTSNPYSPRTSNDPYTDFEKVSGRIDRAVSLIARDPMIPAYPIIGVQMEKLLVSKNETISNEAGTSMSKETSYSTSSSNTVGTSVTGQVGYSFLSVNASVSVSTEYSHTWQNSSTVAESTGDSFSSGLSINKGQSAYINPNVRYYNTGTAPVYELSPNITISLEGDAIVSVQAQQNQVGGYLNPGNFYPKNNLPPIAFNTMDQFNSHLIPINYDQLQAIDNKKTIKLSISQFSGNFAKLDYNGALVTNGNNWAPYLGQIEASSASITLDMKDSVREVRIVARNEKDKSDYTPEITLREALKKAFELEEENGKIYYEGFKIPDELLVSIVMDNEAKSQFDSQLLSMTNKNFLDCIIRPGINILIKVIEVKHDPIENGEYRITSYLNNNKCLDVHSTSVSNDDVTIWDNNNGDNQKWKVEYLPEKKAYKIISVKNNKALAWSSTVSDNIFTYNYSESTLDQHWILKDSGYGSYNIISYKDNNKFMDLYGSNLSNGTNIHVYEKNDDRNQKWIFKKWDEGLVVDTTINSTINLANGFTSDNIIDITGLSNKQTGSDGVVRANTKSFSFKINSATTNKKYRISITTVNAESMYSNNWITCSASIASKNLTVQKNIGPNYTTTEFDYDFSSNNQGAGQLIVNCTSTSVMGLFVVTVKTIN